MPVAIMSPPAPSPVVISPSPIVVSVSVDEAADAPSIVVPAAAVLNILCNAWRFDTGHRICGDRCGLGGASKCECCNTETRAQRKCPDHEGSLSSRRRVLGVVKSNDRSAVRFLLGLSDDDL